MDPSEIHGPDKRMRGVVSADTKEEVERIHEKQEDGEKLTRSEAGILGGASRAKE